jgi:hypothetical protein
MFVASSFEFQRVPKKDHRLKNACVSNIMKYDIKKIILILGILQKKHLNVITSCAY